MSIKHLRQFIILACLTGILSAFGHVDYTIRNIQVLGNSVLAHSAVIGLSGLQEGMVLNPTSKQVQKAVKKISQNPWIKSVEIYLSNVDDLNRLASLVIQVEEYQKLKSCVIEGVTLKEKKALLEHMHISGNVALSPLFLHQKRTEIQSFFSKKGFTQTTVSLDLLPTVEPAKKILKISIQKGKKRMVDKISFIGNDHFHVDFLVYKLKELKPAPHFTLFKDLFKRIITLQPFKKGGILNRLPKKIDDCIYYFSTHVCLFPSTFTEEKYLKAKTNCISFYHSQGFLDMNIVKERLRESQTGKLHIEWTIEEGKQYKIRRIRWVGNTLYSDEELNSLLNLKDGNIYDPIHINSRLAPGTTEPTIADLYTNNGYVFFRAEAIETSIEGDQIDLEIRLFEGKQATIQGVNISGNTLTHDTVIRRELTTIPGAKYNRSRVIESLQNLAMLDFFDPKKLFPEVHPNEEKNSVDITYHVKEQPKFDFKLQGTYDHGIVFSLVLGSKNVSVRNLFMGKVPIGAAQQLHLTASLRGQDYKNISFSFKEPWLWIKGKRYLFSCNINSSYQVYQHAQKNPLDKAISAMLFPFATLEYEKSITASTGGRISLGQKISKYWEFHVGMDYHHQIYRYYKLFDDLKKRSGKLHDFSLDITLLRSSINHIHFPTGGWSWSHFFVFTPPYTALGYKGTQSLPPTLKEFGKFMTDASFFQHLPANFVLNFRGHIGLLWSLSKKTIGPFQRFYMGGTSMDMMDAGILGYDFIPLRGYPNGSLTPKNYENNIEGGVLYHKFVAELRYPIMVVPACIYLLSFLEMADNWRTYQHYNLLDMKKSIGLGMRINMPIPIIPMFGIDLGYRVDSINQKHPSRNNFELHFSVGPSLR